MDANLGSSIVFSSLKKLRNESSSPVSKLSGSHNSNDMSLVVENLNRHYYEKLSPGLDALLAESKKILLSVTAPDDVTTSKSPRSAENESLLSLSCGDNTVSLSNYARKEQGVTYSHDKPNGDVAEVSSKLDEPDGILGNFFPKNLSPNAFDVTAHCLSEYRPYSSPYQLSKNAYETPLALSKSPVKQQTLLTAGTPCKDLEMNQLKKFMDFDKDQGVAPEENLVDPNLSTKTSSVDIEALEMKASSNLPTSEVNHFKQLTVLEATDGRDIDITNKENFGSTDNFTILGKGNKSRFMHPKILDRGIKNSTNTSRFTNNLTDEEFRAILGGTGSSSPSENLNEISLNSQRGQSNDLETLECPNDVDMETTIGQERRHWTNIFSKFSKDTKHLIFGPDYEFNFKMFDVHGDLLVHLQKSKLYEMLSTDAAA
ncbi:uncharacterized protein [Primulina eburnea]|uniref:uncharacterized protein isoform X1 n=1 Tax=Primulina eburnea TaxID=1245227 RepID=UPI003C6C4BBE